MFRVLGTIVDSNKTRFVAMAEGKKYPFFGVQFHPEKIA
jgi:anthranilate/para-aminobenzoate synthase component II